MLYEQRARESDTERTHLSLDVLPSGPARTLPRPPPRAHPFLFHRCPRSSSRSCSACISTQVRRLDGDALERGPCVAKVASLGPWLAVRAQDKLPNLCQSAHELAGGGAVRGTERREGELGRSRCGRVDGRTEGWRREAVVPRVCTLEVKMRQQPDQPRGRSRYGEASEKAPHRTRPARSPRPVRTLLRRSPRPGSPAQGTQRSRRGRELGEQRGTLPPRSTGSRHLATLCVTQGASQGRTGQCTPLWLVLKEDEGLRTRPREVT